MRAGYELRRILYWPTFVSACFRNIAMASQSITLTLFHHTIQKGKDRSWHLPIAANLSFRKTRTSLRAIYLRFSHQSKCISDFLGLYTMPSHQLSKEATTSRIHGKRLRERKHRRARVMKLQLHTGRREFEKLIRIEPVFLFSRSPLSVLSISIRAFCTVAWFAVSSGPLISYHGSRLDLNLQSSRRSMPKEDIWWLPPSNFRIQGVDLTPAHGAIPLEGGAAVNVVQRVYRAERSVNQLVEVQIRLINVFGRHPSQKFWNSSSLDSGNNSLQSIVLHHQIRTPYNTPGILGCTKSESHLGLVPRKKLYCHHFVVLFKTNTKTPMAHCSIRLLLQTNRTSTDNDTLFCFRRVH